LPRLRKDQDLQEMHIHLSKEVSDGVRRIASEERGTVSWAVDTLLREALEARKEAKSKAKLNQEGEV